MAGFAEAWQPRTACPSGQHSAPQRIAHALQSSSRYIGTRVPPHPTHRASGELGEGGGGGGVWHDAWAYWCLPRAAPLASCHLAAGAMAHPLGHTRPWPLALPPPIGRRARVWDGVPRSWQCAERRDRYCSPTPCPIPDGPGLHSCYPCLFLAPSPFVGGGAHRPPPPPPVPPIPLPGLSLPPYTPFLSLGRLCHRGREWAGMHRTGERAAPPHCPCLRHRRVAARGMGRHATCRAQSLAATEAVTETPQRRRARAVSPRSSQNAWESGRPRWAVPGTASGDPGACGCPCRHRPHGSGTRAPASLSTSRGKRRCAQAGRAGVGHGEKKGGCLQSGGGSARAVLTAQTTQTGPAPVRLSRGRAPAGQ